MKKTKLAGDVELLRESLSRLKESLAWWQLLFAESRLEDPPVLATHPDLAADLTNEQCRFMKLASDILEDLDDFNSNKCTYSLSTRFGYREEVLNLVAEMRRLPIPKGL